MPRLRLVTTLCDTCAERRAPLRHIQSGTGVARQCERCHDFGTGVAIYECVALIPHPERFGEPVIDEDEITRRHVASLVEIGFAFIEGMWRGESQAADRVALALNCVMSDNAVRWPSYPTMRDWLSNQEIVYHAYEYEAQRAALYITQRPDRRGAFSQP